MPITKKHVVGGAAGLAMLTAGIAAGWEGFEPVAKHERIDPPGVITYGYGRTNYDDKNLKVGDTITKEHARAFLAADLEYKYLPPLKKCIHNFDAMPIWRQAAVLDASYNLGPATVCRSSIVRNLNAGNVRAACNAFMLYTRANGVVLRGLENRRRAERDLCNREG